MSSEEMRGKYGIALARIRGETGRGGARQKPIYQRNSQFTEQQAIEEAANALSALWKVRKPDKG